MPETGPTLFFMLAAERSGTHMLRSLLTQTGEVTALAETANAVANAKSEANLSFFKFRHNALAANPRLIMPTEDNQMELLSSYFAMLRNKCDDRKVLVCDIKYGHVQSFNSGWWDLNTPPTLITFARRNRIRIIHLVREKVYRTALSLVYAQATGVWRTVREDELPTQRIKVDIQDLENRARRIAGTTRIFRRWLSTRNELTITYEDLTGDGRQHCLAQLKAFLGLSNDIAFAPEFLKVTPPYEQAVQNTDEVLPLLELGIDDMAAAKGQHEYFA